MNHNCQTTFAGGVSPWPPGPQSSREQIIIQALLQHGPKSLTQIVTATALPRTSVSKLLKTMAAQPAPAIVKRPASRSRNSFKYITYEVTP